jgi:hypothetical protein
MYQTNFMKISVNLWYGCVLLSKFLDLLKFYNFLKIYLGFFSPDKFTAWWWYTPCLNRFGHVDFEKRWWVTMHPSCVWRADVSVYTIYYTVILLHCPVHFCKYFYKFVTVLKGVENLWINCVKHLFYTFADFFRKFTDWQSSSKNTQCMDWKVYTIKCTWHTHMYISLSVIAKIHLLEYMNR